MGKGQVLVIHGQKTIIVLVNRLKMVLVGIVRYLKWMFLAFLLGNFSSPVFAQTIFWEDFDSYRGEGFQANPVAGQLDSDFWSISGLSDGDLDFGGSETSGDYARGSSYGGARTGGIYGFELGENSGDYILGAQATGTDFTPGSIQLRFTNTTGGDLQGLIVSYDIAIFNDADRSNSFNFAHKDDSGDTFTAIPALDYTTPEASDSSPTWKTIRRTTTITGITLAAGDDYFLQWSLDGVGGTGSMDQFGLNNVLISAIPEPSTYALFFGSIALGIAIWRKRRRAA